MKPIVSTTLKRLTALITSDAPAVRNPGASFGRWDKSHFNRWTQAPASGRGRVRQTGNDQARQTYAMYYQ